MPPTLTRVLGLMPLLAVVVLYAHTQFLLQPERTLGQYFSMQLQLLLQCAPFFIAHWLATRHQAPKALWIWAAGFVAYPTLVEVTLGLFANSAADEGWRISALWQMCALASVLCWWLGRTGNGRQSRLSGWVNTLFSLDSMIALLVIIWALTVAGVLASQEDALMNQPVEPVVDFAVIGQDIPLFLHYCWQMLVYALVLIGLYLFNRYVLVRKVLSQYGALVFISSVLVATMLLTPILAALLIALPLNDLPDYVANLTPGGGQNLFSKYNFHALAAVFAITTPVILAYERKQQDARWHEAQQQKTQTELKLLQQQINPHFLFNTLNNLYALTLKRADEAPEGILRLSDMLRYTVYEGQKNRVSLAQEIHYLQDFIALQTLRFGQRGRFECQWPQHADSVQIAPLLLIVLVENAIKHGAELASGEFSVQLICELRGNQLRLRCINPREPDASKGAGGMGLSNLARRLALQYPNRHQLTHQHSEQQWCSELTMELEAC